VMSITLDLISVRGKKQVAHGGIPERDALPAAVALPCRTASFRPARCMLLSPPASETPTEERHTMIDRSRSLIAILATLLLASCATAPAPPAVATPQSPPVIAATAPPATDGEARRFVEEAEARLLELGVEANRAAWIQSNFITPDSQILAAAANERVISAAVEYAKAATRFDGAAVADDVRRKLDLLKLALTMPAPSDPAKTRELTQIAARMEATYGESKGRLPNGTELDLEKLSDIVDDPKRTPKERLDAWTAWHNIGRTMRSDYQRFVELTNEGARELGFSDTGAMWRSKYDMPPEAFNQEVERLWNQVKPLYDSLHCFVRAELVKEYGPKVVPPTGPIPAHLLGNMWGQEWGNIYDLVAPGAADPGYDLTERLKAKKLDAVGIVRIGETFFTSLGFEPLPQTFWERSLFVKPQDREVVCHASAWDVDEVDDLRIKMCIQVDAEDFRTVHHELGHNFYQRAYNQQPYLFRNSAHDGFHEAVGDTISLSITPKYLVDIGMIAREPDTSKDLGLLMRDALESIAFLPFGLVVDQWRWQVFSGQITPANYNKAWWDLRRKYQGIAPAIERTEADFDPGAKYHIPGNTPYTRYFLARILQYQFHRALCQTAGYQGPLNRCSIYGNEAAGQRLQNMLAMGASRPWPEALEAGTGQREQDATAIIDYFAPLKQWLDTQNRGRQCGWQ
jgi:peptidyl-dipeptidase A